MTDPRHNDEHHRRDDEKIDLMYLTLFGNKEVGTKGMVDKLDRIYEFIEKVSTGYSMLKWFFGSVIVLGIFISTVKGWLIAFVTHFLTTK